MKLRRLTLYYSGKFDITEIKTNISFLIVYTPFIGMTGLYTDLNAHNYMNFAKDISKATMFIQLKICQRKSFCTVIYLCDFL